METKGDAACKTHAGIGGFLAQLPAGTPAPGTEDRQPAHGPGAQTPPPPPLIPKALGRKVPLDPRVDRSPRQDRAWERAGFAIAAGGRRPAPACGPASRAAGAGAAGAGAPTSTSTSTAAAAAASRGGSAPCWARLAPPRRAPPCPQPSEKQPES